MTSTYLGPVSPRGTTTRVGGPSVGTFVGSPVITGGTVVGAPVTTYSSGVVGALPTTNVVSTGNFGGLASGGVVSGGYVSGGVVSTSEVIKGTSTSTQANQELSTFPSNKLSPTTRSENMWREFPDREPSLNTKKGGIWKLFQEKLPRSTTTPSNTSRSTSLRSLLRLTSKWSQLREL